MADKRDTTTSKARDELERSLIDDLRTIIRIVERDADSTDKRLGISRGQLKALRLIAQQPGIRVTELSAALSLHPSTTSNLLDKLQRRKLIRRRRGGKDQRVVSLQVTAMGRRVATETREDGGALISALAALPDQDIEGLAESLRSLRDKLDSGSEEF